MLEKILMAIEYPIRLPSSLISATEKLVESIKESLKQDVRKIPRDKSLNYYGVFTDGSFVVSDRRGASISLFSSVSILSRIDAGKIKVIKSYKIDPKETLFLLLPKFAVRTRAGTIMRMLEYITSLNLAEDADYLFFDGSYLTTLLLPQSVLSSAFYEVTSVLEDSESWDTFLEVLRTLSNSIITMLKMMKIKDFSFRDFIDSYYALIEELLEITSYMKKNAVISTQNFFIMFIEINIATHLLALLLETCEKNKIIPVWISKDSESRILAKERSASGFSNDLTIMDFVLDRDEYLLLSDVINLPPVSLEKVSSDDPSKIKKNGVYFIIYDIARRVYGKYSSYDVLYAKFAEFSIQLTFPREMVDHENVLIALRSISNRGYPEPMAMVHNLAVLREKAVEILAEGLRRKCNISEIFCNLLSESGRRKIGI